MNDNSLLLRRNEEHEGELESRDRLVDAGEAYYIFSSFLVSFFLLVSRTLVKITFVLRLVHNVHR